jgi:DNA polymerase III subunit gamma/tau
MSYVVSARKYRPQTFEDVVGQEHITSTLKNALMSDKLAHAFLFCGPRGVGKTTCARLLAKVINMPDPKAALADGSYAMTDIDISMNIIELDAASNNSVEHMRTLIEQVRFQPQQGKYKVFIIDEVHMLSASAFNAFLKTLEEPPPYAIFILATTEKHKILPTIMSRCQLYDFRRIQVTDIIHQLEKIAQTEGVKTEFDGLYTIAEKADGAMRDALSIYDRIASASQNVISYKSVVDNLNLLDFEYFFRATDLIVREDGPGLLLLLEEVLAAGFDGDIFMNGLSKHLRNLMYCKQEPTLQLLQLSDQLKLRFLDQSQTITYSTILTALSLANDSDINYPKAKDKRLHIEIALLKICYSNRQVEISPNVVEKKNSEHLEKPIIHTKEAATFIENPKAIPESNQESEEIKKPKKEEVNQAHDDEKEPRPTNVEKKKMLDTPSISSIEALLEAAELEISSKQKEAKTLDIAEVQLIWSQYVDSIESPTTRAIIDNIILSVDDQKIVGYVPSNISKEEIQHEAPLYQKLRDHFNQNDLMIKIVVDREKFPGIEEPVARKLFTAKEKYDHLISINPLLDNLIDELGLSPEQD